MPARPGRVPDATASTGAPARRPVALLFPPSLPSSRRSARRLVLHRPRAGSDGPAGRRHGPARLTR